MTRPNQPDSETKSPFSNALLILLFALSFAIFWLVDAENSISGRPSVDMLVLASIVVFGFYLWVRTWSGMNHRNQIIAIGAMVVVSAALFACVQMDGLYGNGRPVFAWRWRPQLADLYEPNADLNNTAKPNSISLPTLGQWPQYRGPHRDGIASVSTVNWNQHLPKELWRIPIGSGWSSCIVVGDYCFTQEQRSKYESTVCYETATGKEVWVFSDIERFSEITAGEGPRATPSFNDGKIYSLGATGILNCLDAATGDKIWTVSVLVSNEAENCLFGTTASPLVVGDKVIVSPGAKGASLVAYHKSTGKLIWKSGDAQASYSSPMLAEFHGVQQVLIFNGEGLYGHDLESGEILWSIPWVSNSEEKNNVCQPILIGDNCVFISSGYGEGCATYQVRFDGKSFFTHELWYNTNLKSKFSCAVFDGEHVFGLDEGILVCLDPETGERLWKSGRYGHGQVLLAGDHLVVQAEKGYLSLVEASHERFEEIARVQALHHRTWNHPCLASPFLLVRNDRELVCFEIETTPLIQTNTSPMLDR